MPVNEYKIADKIIEANKSLFESTGQMENNSEVTTESENKENVLNMKKPRVTFSSDIEEYDDGDDENASIHSNATEENDNAANHKSNEEDGLAQESQTVKTESNDETIPECNNNEPAKEVGEKPDECMENIEEICEDIDVIKLDPPDDNEIMEEIGENFTENDARIDAEKIDCIENQNMSSPPENAIKMDTNEILETVAAKIDETEGTQCTTEKTSDSALKPEPITRTSKSASEKSKKQPTVRKSQTAPILRKTKAEHPRRKIKSSTTSNHIDHDEVDELLRIQLNFKCCCEHKYLENSRLPRYKGYFSQYGLSKEELEARAARKELTKKLKYENWLRKNEEKQLKSQINEHAYAQWLQEKLQKVRNKEKNMYDFNNQKKQKKTAPTLLHMDSWKY